MNRRNQGKSEKSEYIYKKRKKVRGADEVLKRALADCMQEETAQQMLVRFPLVEDVIALHGGTDGVEHIAVAL